MDGLPATEKTPRPLQILLVSESDADVEPMSCELRRAEFAPSWQRVETLAGFEEALVREPWDLVLSDWTLPALDARRAFAVLEESGLDLPFIIVADAIGEQAALEAMRAGINDILARDNLARLGAAVERELRETVSRVARRRIEEHLVVSDRMVTVGTLAAGVARGINNPLATGAREPRAGHARDGRSAPRAGGSAAPARAARRAARRAGSGRARADHRARPQGLLPPPGRSHGPIDLRRVLDSSARMAWNKVAVPRTPCSRTTSPRRPSRETKRGSARSSST